MIRFSWLQFRLQAAGAAGVLVIIALALALTGPHLAHLYATTVANCSARSDCSTATVSFLSHYRLLQDLRQPRHCRARPRRHVLGRATGGPRTGDRHAAPGVDAKRHPYALVGRETRPDRARERCRGGPLEPHRDLVVKADRPAEHEPVHVGVRPTGVVPIGYAAFAFVLGVAAGLLARRTLPAMAATLVAFVSVRVLVTFWVRPHLMAPVQTTSRLRMTTGMSFNQTDNGPLSVMGAKPGAWVFSDHIVSPSGGSVSGGFLSHGACLQSRASAACIGKLREVLVYQPASRYWAFQWYEMAIFIGLAVVLSGLCFWCVRRRLS